MNSTDYAALYRAYKASEQRVRDLEGWPEISCQQALQEQLARAKTVKRLLALRAKCQQQARELAFVHAQYQRLATK